MQGGLFDGLMMVKPSRQIKDGDVLVANNGPCGGKGF